MSKIVNIQKIQDLIIEIRNTRILLDSDIADLYEVETRDVNKSVKNNPDKFPEGYVFELSKDELEALRWKFSTAKLSKTRVMPKAFTEKGLYMLATILKSKKVVETTLGIIEAFTKIRELSSNVKEISNVKDAATKNQLLQKSGKLIAEVLYDDLEIADSETSIELNFAVLKFKHTVKKTEKMKNILFRCNGGRNGAEYAPKAQQSCVR